MPSPELGVEHEAPEIHHATGGAAAAWPLAARAQQPERGRRSDRIRLIGVLLNLTEDDPQVRVRIVAFQQELEKFGWVEGRDLRFEYRFTAGIAGREDALAKELVALQPDLILSHGYTTTALHRATTRYRSCSCTSLSQSP